MIIKLSPQVNDNSEDLVITIQNGTVTCTPTKCFITDEPAGEFAFIMPIRYSASEAECWPSLIEIPDDFEGVLDYKSMLVSCKPTEEVEHA